MSRFEVVRLVVLRTGLVLISSMFVICLWGLVARAVQPSDPPASESKGINRERDEATISDLRGGDIPHIRFNIQGHTAPVRALAFTSDSSGLCSAGADKVVHVWRIPEFGAKGVGREYRLLERTIRWEVARGIRGTINCAAVSKNDQLVFAGFGGRGALGEIIWCDPLDGAFLRSDYLTHENPIAALAWSADGRWMVSSDLFGKVCLWPNGQKTARVLHQSDGHFLGARPVAVAGAEQVVIPHASGTLDLAGNRKIQIWKLQCLRPADGVLLQTIDTPHYAAITALASSANGQIVVSADLARRMFVFHRSDGQPWGNVTEPFWKGHMVMSLSCSADGKRLAVGTLDEGERAKPQVCVWDVDTGQAVFSRQMPQSVLACAVSPNGQWLAYTGGDRDDIFLQQLVPGGHELVLHGGQQIQWISPVDASDDYSVRFATTDGTAGTFQPSTRQIEHRRPSDPMPSTQPQPVDGWSASISPTKDTLQLERNGNLKGRVHIDLKRHGVIQCYDFVRDESGHPRAVVIGTGSRHGIYVYQLAESGDCALLRYFRGHENSVQSVRATRDGKYVISGSRDGTIRYWRLEGCFSDDVMVRRWGATFQPTSNATLQVANIIDSGPMHHRGVVDGDEITKILWTQRDADGNSTVYSEDDPDNMRRQLQTLPWDKIVSFETTRQGQPRTPFNLASGWTYYLAVFLYNRDWIAWNPAGYYATSAGGERLIGWQINGEPGVKPSYFGATRFAKTLYQPDLISALLTSGTLDQAKQRVGLHGATAQIDNPNAVRPPKVRLVSPVLVPGEHVKRVTDPHVRVIAVAEPFAQPITSMRLLLNGRPYQERQQAKGIAREHTAEMASWEITLPAGKNVLRVLADTGVSQGISDELNVEYVAKARTPNLYGVAIGISDYPEDDLRLDYASSDATRFAEAVSNYGKDLFESIEVTTLLDAEATSDHIIAALTTLQKTVTPSDVVVVFFSGHGVRDAEHFYLFSVNGDRNKLADTCVSDSAIKQFCEAVPCKLILLLDACHSGAFQIESLATELRRDNYGAIVMASSEGEESSWERDEWQAGAFTKALTEGIEGLADGDHNTYVLTIELKTYVYTRVVELTESSQNPVATSPTYVRPFKVSHVPK